MRCMVEYTPIKVLQLVCLAHFGPWAMTPLIIGLPYDHPQPSGSWQFTYTKNLGF